jgi:hypothetical protein
MNPEGSASVAEPNVEDLAAQLLEGRTPAPWRQDFDSAGAARDQHPAPTQTDTAHVEVEDIPEAAIPLADVGVTPDPVSMVGWPKANDEVPLAFAPIFEPDSESLFPDAPSTLFPTPAIPGPAELNGSVPLAEEVPEASPVTAADFVMPDPRRLDIDAKQELIARLLHDCECEGLLVQHPANFRWLTAGASPAGLSGRDEAPALFFNAHQRWLLASATDSSRLFADELDGLGFQVKEWHWSASREQLLADLIFNRKVACDQPFRDCKPTGPFFVSGRRRLSAYEIDQLAELGQVVSHAVAATAKGFDWGDSEDEIGGHLAHRLLRHGVEPVVIQINGDGRGRAHRRRGHGSRPVEQSCVLQVTARKYGLHATCARTVFRTIHDDETERAEFEAALRMRVAHLALSRVGGRVQTALDAGHSVLRPTPFEHEWRLSPPVCLTGREPSEGVFRAGVEDRWSATWAAVWQERIGAAAIVDTYLMDPDGWRPMTPPKEWPIRRAVSQQGREFDLADLLVRD